MFTTSTNQPVIFSIIVEQLMIRKFIIEIVNF